MDKIVEFLISNLQPAIDAIKQAAPDVIARETRWLLWAYNLTLYVGVALAVATVLLIVARILIGIFQPGYAYDSWGTAAVVFAVFFGLAGFICILVGSIELKHLAINPAYVLLQHFMGK